jgi:hypothetical protein
MPHGLTQLEKGESSDGLSGSAHSKDNSIAGCWYKSSVISSIVNLELVCKIVSYKNLILTLIIHGDLSLFQSAYEHTLLLSYLLSFQ